MIKPLTVLVLLFLISSCEKYNYPVMPEDPLWLEEKISEIQAGTNYGIKIESRADTPLFLCSILNLPSIIFTRQQCFQLIKKDNNP